MVILEICKEMHWDYLTFRKQPQHFIDIAESRLIAKLKVQNGNK